MAEGLAGIQVLELGGGLAAPLVGKLLADLGAAVVKVEPPGGEPGRRRGPFPGGEPHPERSGFFTALNAGKRSLELDLRQGAGRAALEGLLPSAHVLVHDLPPREMAAQGLDYARFSRLQPRLVMLSLTPFGLSGPYRDYVAADLTLMHGGGWGWLCPGPGTDPALPPIKPYGQHALAQAAVHGAVAALGVLFGALASGVGDHIDFSCQEAVIGLLGRNFSSYSYGGQVDSRLSARSYAPNGFFRCRDGWVYLVCIEEEQWRRLVELMGNPAWAGEERFRDREIRAVHEEELNRRLTEWIGGWTALDFFLSCQQRRICASKVFTFDELPAQEHLQAREFPRCLEQPGLGRVSLPGPPYRLRRPWWALRGPAPRLGEANGQEGALFSAQGVGAAARSADAWPSAGRASAAPGAQSSALPLQGVRVLDLTWVWAGPHATLLLAQLGADVVKVESAARPDLLRRVGTPAEGLEPGVNRRGSFNQLAQGKRSVTINLSHPGGLELVRRLARHCDAVTSNFGTGVMERFGLGAEELLRLNPQLIVAAISGYGQTGPYRNFMGYGQAAVPLSGISAWTGYRAGHPQEVHIAYGDPAAGVCAALGVAAALVARRLHGPAGGGQAGAGQFIDVSLWEALLCAGFEGWMHSALGLPPLQPMGNRDAWWAPHNCYRCSGEDAWVSIAVTEEAQWPALCQAIGQPQLATDARFADAAARKRHEDELDALIGAWCGGRERWQITRDLQAAGVAAFPSLSSRDLAEDPHLRARGYFGHASHPEVGARLHLGVPWRLARSPGGVRGRAPLLGEHTRTVLQEWLGLDAGEVDRLQSERVLE